MDIDKMKFIGFKPGFGHVYEDNMGHKHIVRFKEAKPKQKVGFMNRETGHKIHMSKKQRRKLKEGLYGNYLGSGE